LDILTDTCSLSAFILRNIRNIKVVRDHVTHPDVHGLGNLKWSGATGAPVKESECDTFLAEQVVAQWCAVRVCVLDVIKTEAADFAIVGFVHAQDFKFRQPRHFT